MQRLVNLPLYRVTQAKLCTSLENSHTFILRGLFTDGPHSNKRGPWGPHNFFYFFFIHQCAFVQGRVIVNQSPQCLLVCCCCKGGIAERVCRDSVISKFYTHTWVDCLLKIQLSCPASIPQLNQMDKRLQIIHFTGLFFFFFFN